VPAGLGAEYKTLRDEHNELTLDLREQVAPRRALQVVFRVFDNGVGFRYALPRQRAIDRFARTGARPASRTRADNAMTPPPLAGRARRR